MLPVTTSDCVDPDRVGQLVQDRGPPRIASSAFRVRGKQDRELVARAARLPA
jgi:hypothetical protein